MYNRIYDMLNCEIEKIENKGELNQSSLDNLDKLVDIIKDLQTIEAMSFAEERNYGYSNNSGMDYSRGRMMYDDSRYYRGRPSNYGYSYGNDRNGMIEHLQKAIDQANSEEERNEIRQMIDRMQNRK